MCVWGGGGRGDRLRGIDVENFLKHEISILRENWKLLSGDELRAGSIRLYVVGHVDCFLTVDAGS